MVGEDFKMLKFKQPFNWPIVRLFLAKMTDHFRINDRRVICCSDPNFLSHLGDLSSNNFKLVLAMRAPYELSSVL